MYRSSVNLCTIGVIECYYHVSEKLFNVMSCFIHFTNHPEYLILFCSKECSLPSMARGQK